MTLILNQMKKRKKKKKMTTTKKILPFQKYLNLKIVLLLENKILIPIQQEL